MLNWVTLKSCSVLKDNTTLVIRFFCSVFSCLYQIDKNNFQLFFFNSFQFCNTNTAVWMRLFFLCPLSVWLFAVLQWDTFMQSRWRQRSVVIEHLIWSAEDFLFWGLQKKEHSMTEIFGMLFCFKIAFLTRIQVPAPLKSSAVPSQIF